MLAIQISLKKNAYHLGEPIPASVVYRNNGTSAISLEDPSRSFNAEMHVVDRSTKEDHYYTMGKLEVTEFEGGLGEYALVEPVPDSIDIAPKADFVFETDINKRLYLGPGVFDCEFRDSDTRSNQATIAIWYTQDSVALLLGAVMDASLDYGRREWAADWLRELLPDFRVTLPPDGEEPGSAPDDSVNQAEYQRFRAWWQENRDSAETKQTLEQLNRVINSAGPLR